MAGMKGRWVRRATRAEASFEMLGHHEFMLVCTRLSVASDLPLDQHHVKQALTHLLRKTPNLRVCFGDKDGSRWLREMTTENIDFQVVKERSVEEVTQTLHTYQYNTSDGPLWCARLIPATDTLYTTPRFSRFCSDLQVSFPHRYHIMFGFHHSVGDGNTFKKIIRSFIAILDDVLSESPVNDGEQLGKFEVNEEFDRLMADHEEKIESDPALKQVYIDDSKKGQPEKSLLDQILPPPEEEHRKTLLVSQNFDCETTSRFIRRGKAEGITVNSSFTAICNVALGDLLDEKGIKQDKYVISNAHLIDCRRFWDPQVAADNLGCYISLSNRVFVETPSVVDKEEFWNLARTVHRDFYKLLTCDDVLQRLAFVTVCMKCLEPYNDRELNFNALGDLSSLFAGRKHLQVTHMVISTGIHMTPYVWEHNICSVRGRLIHTIKYNSGLVTKELVTQYMDHIYRRVHEVII